jgi:tetratricopeptide (TPR) repeat protein
MKNIKIALIICLTVFFGCKTDWLDQKPDKNLTTPATLKDYEALLDQQALSNSCLGAIEDSSDGHYITEDTWANDVSQSDRNLYTWTHNFPYINYVPWNTAYRNLLTVNLVLDGLSKIDSNQDKIRWTTIRANALFYRANIFNDLAQIWAPQYIEGTAKDDKGFPLRLGSDINQPSKSSSVKEIYDQIFKDLLEAKDILPVTPKYKTRGSKAAAFALLAKTYLNQGKYEQAYLYADSCLNLNNKLLDYNTLNLSANFIGMFNDEVVFHKTGGGLTLDYDSKVDPVLYHKYESNDLRKSVFYRLEGDGSIIFKGSYSNQFLFGKFFGIATDEILLLRAETYARAGKVIEAMNDLNVLLVKRYKIGTYVARLAINADDALRQIISEREKELIYRGIRWSDLRRLNLDSRFKITLSRTIGGTTYLLEPNSYKYTLPIPDDEIQLSGISQTVGW